MKTIESTQNEIIKKYAKLSQKKYRDLCGLYMIEGVKNSYDSLLNMSLAEIEAILICPEKLKAFLSDFPRHEIYIICADKAILKKVSDYTSETEIIVIAKKREHSVNVKNELCIYLDSIRDPGNLGTIIRTAAGTDFGVILNDCCDVYSPKVVRACMSAISTTNICYGDASVLKKYKSLGYRIIGADASGRDIFATEKIIGGKLIIAVGNEAEGLSNETRLLCDAFTAIPIKGIESLNAAIAASVLMLEYKYRILA